jgi:signal transduction histidine kinase
MLVVAAAVAVLVVGSAHREARALGAAAGQAWLVPLVGIVFLTAGVLARGPVGQRVLMAAVGVAWLLGSFSSRLLVLHQGVLLAALVALPRLRWRRWLWVFVAVSVPVGLAGLSPPWVAALFLSVALVSMPRASTAPGIAAVAGGSAVAVALGVSWWLAGRPAKGYDPNAWLVTYECVLVAVAAGVTIAGRARAAGVGRLTDRVLGDERSLGLEGLRGVLADLLGDPTLRITRYETGSAGEHVDSGLVVGDGARPIAVVHHRAAALRDPMTRASVAEAVRLMIASLERREELARRLVELRAAQERVVSATDHQRAVSAAQLREEVVAPLEKTAAALSAVRVDPAAEPTTASALAVVVGEISSAAEDVDRLVAGAPPVALGGGRLGKALKELGGRCPLPTTVTVSGRAEADAAGEAALFYVCSEALVNAHKHAHAGRASVTLTAADDCLTLVVSDDGCGGADLTGNGLRGLRDRVTMVGGSLGVASPRSGGTTVTAVVPCQPMRRQGRIGR